MTRFSIEPDRKENDHDLSTVPEDVQLSSLLSTIDTLVNDINEYSNNTQPTAPSINPPNPNHSQSRPNESRPIINKSEYANNGLAAIAERNRRKKELSKRRSTNFKTNNPKKKLQEQPTCPWKKLRVRDTISSYVLCCWLSILLDSLCLFEQKGVIISKRNIYHLLLIGHFIGVHCIIFSKQYSNINALNVMNNKE